MFKPFLVSLIAMGLPIAASACDLPAERPSFIDVQEKPDFDTATFAALVAQAIGDRYMGYAVTLRGENGRIIAQVNHATPALLARVVASSASTAAPRPRLALSRKF